MPYSRLRPGHPHPHSFLVSVLLEMLKTCLPLQDKMTQPSTQEKALFFVALGHLSLLRKQRYRVLEALGTSV